MSLTEQDLEKIRELSILVAQQCVYSSSNIYYVASLIAEALTSENRAGLTNGYKSEVLETARSTYGEKNQICVATEELCELACVLSKFPRYDAAAEAVAATRQKVLDEFADVTVVLEHVKKIFSLTDTEIHDAQKAKIDRLERWLKNDDSGSMKETTVDRAVIASSNASTVPDCMNCYYWEHVDEINSERCAACQEKCSKP